MRVQFLLPDASSRRVQVKFPVALTKFMRGRELEQREFFHTWRQQHFVLNEVSSVVNLSPKLGLLCDPLAWDDGTATQTFQGNVGCSERQHLPSGTLTSDVRE